MSRTDRAALARSSSLLLLLLSLPAVADAATRDLPSSPPAIDGSTVVFFADEGRLELRGAHLGEVRILWWIPNGNGSARTGSSTCEAPARPGLSAAEHCAVPLPAWSPLETRFAWEPRRQVPPSDPAAVFDPRGAVVGRLAHGLRPAGVHVLEVISPKASVDVTLGAARVRLVHPGAASAVDCGAEARCELSDGDVLVRQVPPQAESLVLRVRLIPGVTLLRPDGAAPATLAVVTLPIVRCPLTIASGAPLREVDDSLIVIRTSAHCGASIDHLRFGIDGIAADVRRTVTAAGDTFIVLLAGRLLRDRVVVVASRTDLDATVTGSTIVPTAQAPQPRVTLELPRQGKVEFLATNREVELSVAAPGPGARLQPVGLDGAYTVRQLGGKFLVRGDANAGGFATLRFGYRVTSLPGGLAEMDLALLPERVQREVREASVPAPLGTSAEGPAALVELVCAGPGGQDRQVPPGHLQTIAFSAKDTCRIVLHRERLAKEFGTQLVALDVEVTSSEGVRRAEVSFRDDLRLIPGASQRVIPLKGGAQEFDRLVVRLSQVIDESRYTTSEGKVLPSIQWLVAIAGGRFRLYATAAIPAGLYRITRPTGQLNVNFGVLTRVTWLDERGTEGLVGLELGLMGMALLQQSGSTDYPPTLGSVAGIGLRVPLGANAAVGIHLWGTYELRDGFRYKVDRTELGACGALSVPSCRAASHFSLVFGPSISIGDVGRNL